MEACMKVLLVGAGGVGEAIAVVAQDKPWLEKMVLADINPRRVREVKKKLRAPRKFPTATLNARDKRAIVELARRHKVDVILNAVEPLFNEAIFDAAFQARCHYLDMAMTLSSPHPKDPFHRCGVKLGDYQFERSAQWEARGLLALVGMGVEPGLADVFAKYAELHLFDEIDELGVRDGANLIVRGHAFAPSFSIWTTIEECLNPPVIWEKDRGWFTTEPFSEPETFDFPEGIGPIECVNVEHEEVLLVPRWVKCRRVTFKYGLGDEFIGVLKTLHMLGLDNKDAIRVGGVQVAPRDVVAACLPNPATLGDKMSGKTCAGTWVTGRKNGKARRVYLYQVADNETCMRKYGCQAVVWQTGVNPVIALELLAQGVWEGAGVLGPEAFDPVPFMERMAAYDFPYGMTEMTA
jgi:saccharopine dehydrogenase-like NADP-dependent oxidoreductase